MGGWEREGGGLTEGKKSLKLWALIKEKCIPQKSQVKGSWMASFRPAHVPLTSSRRPPLESRTRYCAISLSLGLSHLVFSGQSWYQVVSELIDALGRGEAILFSSFLFLFFFFLLEFGFVNTHRQDEERSDSYQKTGDPFDHKEPLPRSKTRDIAHTVKNPRSEETRNDI